MTDQEKQEEVHQYLYHLRELNKIHAKMIEEQGKDIQIIKTDVAVMKSRMDTFRIENVEQVIVQKPKASAKEIAQTSAGGGVIAAVILGVIKGLWDLWKTAS